ncbi:hypothetical protein K8Q98_00370, partial [Candidatus Nomurabacteria bacterium]|nr:hypothetical protein [Candidatus Nomurabacteria bacterium]
MIKDERAITDEMSATSFSLKDKSLSPVSYTKTDKLISALYMVTDIMDREEPLRLKLRTLGVNIISDLHSNFIMEAHFLHKLKDRINEIMSFLGIAETLNLISAMNSNILLKEFSELKQSIQSLNPDGELSLFFAEEKHIASPILKNSKISFIGQTKSTRIGVQKGNTLMKALSDKVPSLSNTSDDFNNLKKQRQEEILKIIKDSLNSGTEGLTITD